MPSSAAVAPGRLPGGGGGGGGRRGCGPTSRVGLGWGPLGAPMASNASGRAQVGRMYSGGCLWDMLAGGRPKQTRKRRGYTQTEGLISGAAGPWPLAASTAVPRDPVRPARPVAAHHRQARRSHRCRRRRHCWAPRLRCSSPRHRCRPAAPVPLRARGPGNKRGAGSKRRLRSLHNT